MAALLKRSRRLWIAVCLVLGLTILPAITASLAGDELASRIPGIDLAFADESHGGGG